MCAGERGGAAACHAIGSRIRCPFAGYRAAEAPPGVTHQVSAALSPSRLSVRSSVTLTGGADTMSLLWHWIGCTRYTNQGPSLNSVMMCGHQNMLFTLLLAPWLSTARTVSLDSTHVRLHNPDGLNDTTTVRLKLGLKTMSVPAGSSEFRARRPQKAGSAEPQETAHLVASPARSAGYAGGSRRRGDSARSFELARR
jgi:hypothetical protein